MESMLRAAELVEDSPDFLDPFSKLAACKQKIHLAYQTSAASQSGFKFAPTLHIAAYFRHSGFIKKMLSCNGTDDIKTEGDLYGNAL